MYDTKTNCPVPVTPENSFEAKVDVLEKLGAEDTVYLVAEGLTLTASIDPAARIHAGEMAKFAIDLEKIHVFDSDSGAAIR